MGVKLRINSIEKDNEALNANSMEGQQEVFENLDESSEVAVVLDDPIELSEQTIKRYRKRNIKNSGHELYLTKDPIELEIHGSYNTERTSGELPEIIKLSNWEKVVAHEDSSYRKVELLSSDNNGEEYENYTIEKAFISSYHEHYSAKQGNIDFTVVIREFDDRVKLDKWDQTAAYNMNSEYAPQEDVYHARFMANGEIIQNTTSTKDYKVFTAIDGSELELKHFLNLGYRYSSDIDISGMRLKITPFPLLNAKSEKKTMLRIYNQLPTSWKIKVNIDGKDDLSPLTGYSEVKEGEKLASTIIMRPDVLFEKLGYKISRELETLYELESKFNATRNIAITKYNTKVDGETIWLNNLEPRRVHEALKQDLGDNLMDLNVKSSTKTITISFNTPVINSGEIDYKQIANEAISNGTTIQTFRADIPGTNYAVPLKKYKEAFVFKSGMQVDDDGVGNDYNLLDPNMTYSTHNPNTTYMPGTLNADIHPYYVMPYPNKSDIWTGDLAAIIDTSTGKVCYAIHGDNQVETDSNGNPLPDRDRKIGEASVCVHNFLFNANINASNPGNAQNGHGTMDIVYICFPHSRQTNLDFNAIQIAGEALFREYFL